MWGLSGAPLGGSRFDGNLERHMIRNIFPKRTRPIERGPQRPVPPWTGSGSQAAAGAWLLAGLAAGAGRGPLDQAGARGLEARALARGAAATCSQAKGGGSPPRDSHTPRNPNRSITVTWQLTQCQVTGTRSFPFSPLSASRAENATARGLTERTTGAAAWNSGTTSSRESSEAAGAMDEGK